MKPKANHFLLSRLSIQQRLPLLICSLLLICIVIYGFANYYSLKKADLTIGRDRLVTISDQLNTSLVRSTQFLRDEVRITAAQNSVVQYIKSDGKQFHKEAAGELDKLLKDSTYVFAELVNADMEPVLRSNKSSVNINISVPNLLTSVSVGPIASKVGKIYKTNNSAYIPVIAAVTNGGHIIGYVILWNSLLISPKTMAQFSKLVGIGTDIYLGNADGSVWTNLVEVIPGIPFKISGIHKLIEYAAPNGTWMIAKAQSIPRTDWLVVVAFSEESVLSGVYGFVNWVIVIGIVIITLGFTAAWIMSRHITKPLNQLIKIAIAISQGNYSATVPIDMYQNDELGKLAIAFNTMLEQVYNNQHELESKVEERTSQLANVNKELEAFSYSVSHDLRTPLRAINGYSIMLKEDYDAELDTEGKRILRNIISNAKMMGQLIDDLLSFSRLGKKELVRTPIDMQLLAETVVQELLQHEPENKYQINISSVPPISADTVMIKQVLINLVGNAIKYSSKKERPVIEIGAKDEETNTTYFIKDNGAGFDTAYSEKLFGVFQRLHSQEEFEGTGVGLALVKRIIDKHKGEVRAEGIEGAGATFYFSLPKN